MEIDYEQLEQESRIWPWIDDPSIEENYEDDSYIYDDYNDFYC